MLLTRQNSHHMCHNLLSLHVFIDIISQQLDWSCALKQTYNLLQPKHTTHHHIGLYTVDYFILCYFFRGDTISTWFSKRCVFILGDVYVPAGIPYIREDGMSSIYGSWSARLYRQVYSVCCDR